MDSNQGDFQETESDTTGDHQQPELRISLFEGDSPPSWMECLDTIDRVACIIELVGCLKVGEDASLGLPSRATSGYWYLVVMMRDTLLYSSNRLQELNRRQKETYREQSAYLSALRNSLSSLSDSDSNFFINNMAAHLQVARSDVEQFIADT